MDKTTFNEELREYMSRGGDFAFVFGEQHLPVKYNALMGTLGVSINGDRVSRFYRQWKNYDGYYMGVELYQVHRQKNIPPYSLYREDSPIRAIYHGLERIYVY